MPNLLDYERLVRRVADLSVENAILKRQHLKTDAEENKWDTIEKTPVIGTMHEERRLRRIIREWEERYDILNEIYINSSVLPAKRDWYDARNSIQSRRQKMMNQSTYTKWKSLFISAIDKLLRR
jgi:hypothetical protein